MEWYRIANFIMQILYLPLHLCFIIKLVKNRRPTPIWELFTIVVVGLWFMVSGRFLETIDYMFIQENNFYVFAVYYQLVGTTIASFAFLIWNINLARLNNLAKNKLFNIFLILLSLFVIIIICTNDLHHLFYQKLIMGTPVEHGILFYPCLLIVYGALFAGLIVSIVHIIKKEKDKVKKIIVFSLYPLLPAITALIRSITKVDELDLTPIIMMVSIYALYLIVFKYRYVNFISKSQTNILKNMSSIIILYDLTLKMILYKNNDNNDELINYVISKLDETEKEKEELIFSNNNYLIEYKKEDDKLYITITDINDLENEKKKLNETIIKTEELINELEKKKESIEAYLEALYEVPDFKTKYEALEEAKAKAIDSLVILRNNLDKIKENPNNAEYYINENINLSVETVAMIRKVVALIGDHNE